MNENTYTGNVSKIHEVSRTKSGELIFTFDMAIDNGYFDRKGPNKKWISRTVFQTVVTYRDLADNVMNTLCKGMAVTVTGKLVDDSWTPPGQQYAVRRTKLEAIDVAVSLRFATATVTKTTKTTEEKGLEHNREQLAVVA